MKLEHAFADGVAGEPGCRMNIQFVHQALPVFFDCLRADSKFGPDALIGIPLRDEVKHLEFARAERPF